MSIETERGTRIVRIPSKAKVRLDGRRLTVEGPLGSITRDFPNELVKIALSKDTAVLTLAVPSERRHSKALLGTWAAHLGNLVTGVTVGFEARMKVVAAHFPMKVQAKEGSLVIENFLGEKYPRTAHLVPGVSAAVDGDFVTLVGPDIEQVGQSAANIERTTRIRDYDPRVFQDGIFLVDRAHPKGGTP